MKLSQSFGGFGDEDEVLFDTHNQLVVELTDKYPDIYQLKTLLRNNKSFVAGGCFKNILKQEAPRDIDVFFHTAADFDESLAEFMKSTHYIQEHRNPRSVGFRHKTHDLLIDLVCYRYGTPEEILTSFDFTVVKFAYFLRDGEYRVIHHVNFEKHLEEKKLETYTDPVNVDKFFNRVLRYNTYGYNVTRGLKRRMFRAIRVMDAGDIENVSEPGKLY